MRAIVPSTGSSAGFGTGSSALSSAASPAGFAARLATWFPGGFAGRSVAHRHALRVYAALAAPVLAMAALAIFEETRGGALADRITAIGGDPRAPGAEEIAGEVTVFALLLLAVPAAWAVAAAAYLRWLGEVHRSALRAWLIPVVNLVAPPFALHAAWLETDPPAGRRRRWLVLLAAWWLSWLAVLATVAASLLTGDDGLTGLGPAAVAVTALAAALCAATVREVTRGGGHPRRSAFTRIAAAPIAARTASGAVPGRSGPVAGG